MNQFLHALTEKDTFTENKAVSNSSTGNAFVDDFGKAGTYRARPYKEVHATASMLWALNALMFLRLTFYLRMITRQVRGLYTTQTIQKGQGAKDEALKRLLWVAYTQPEVFYKNLWLVPLVGSWKDLWTLLFMDYQNQNSVGEKPYLNVTAFFELMMRGMNDESMKDLVIKYMPQIKSKEKCTTERSKYLNVLAKRFASYMDMNYTEYRKLKSSGQAHKWQQMISKNYYDQINFSHIPGKALSTLVHGKFLRNHNLTKKYEEWLDKQPVVKFNGYPHELLMKISGVPYKDKTINKQFDMLIQTAKADNGGIKGNVWVALDTSGSMSWPESRIEGNVYAIHIAKALAIYFSELNEGAFKNSIIAFNDISKKFDLHGTFTDKAAQLYRCHGMGGTNFQSVIDEIVRIRIANPNIPISDYPQTLLVVSDMQFNPAGSNVNTNYEVAMQKLANVNLPKMTIIWWQVNQRTKDYPSRIDDKGTIVISGFDGAILTLLLGGEQTERSEISMKFTMEQALNQEILNLVQL